MIRIPDILDIKALNALFPDGKEMEKAEIIAIIHACRILMPYFTKEILPIKQEEKGTFAERAKEAFEGIAIKNTEKAEISLGSMLKNNTRYIIKNCITGIFLLEGKEAKEYKKEILKG